MPNTHPNRWIVIADGGHARVLALAPDGNNLTLVHEMNSPDVHKKTHDQVTDHPGRSFESANPAGHANATRHAIAAKTDPHDESEKHFVKAVATYLNKQHQAGAFEDVVLVVDRSHAHVLKEALDHNTGAKVVQVVTKDLVKTPNNDIRDRMAEEGLLPPRPSRPALR